MATNKRTNRAKLDPYFADRYYGNAGTATGATTKVVTLNGNVKHEDYYTGMTVVISNTTLNSGASTLNVNGMGAKAIVTSKNTALVGGEMLASTTYLLWYDGTSFRIVNEPNLPLYGTAAGTDTYTLTLAYGLTPAYYTGMKLDVIFTNANTGAATLNVNTLGAKAIVDSTNNALGAAEIAAGALVTLVYDGTSFRIPGI